MPIKQQFTRVFTLAGTILILASGLSSPALAEVVAKVDGAEITGNEVKIALEDIGKSLPRQMSPAQRQQYAINYLIDLKLAARKAQAENLQNSDQFKRKLEYFRQKALMEIYVDGLSDKAATPENMRAAYDRAFKATKPQTEIKASHILVATREEAEAALKRVQSSEDFAKVAKEISKDPGSPGGDLGWFTKDRMVPSFAEMAFKTEPGKISEPVKSQFGWHIIKVSGRRLKEFPKFEEVNGQIRNFLVQRAQRKAIQELRSSAKIEKLKPKK